jgi:DNA phosphorothioation-dependent restriction protein DptG
MFDSGRQARLFAKGDIKYVILNLLKDKPSHGYEIIHSLEERFHGFYSPSAGSVYPTLQLLEDLGYVIALERDGKKVYTITEAGKNFLEESKPIITRIKSHMHDWQEESDPHELHDAFHDLQHMMHNLSHKTQRMDKRKIEEIKTIIIEACRNIEDIIEED